MTKITRIVEGWLCRDAGGKNTRVEFYWWGETQPEPCWWSARHGAWYPFVQFRVSAEWEVWSLSERRREYDLEPPMPGKRFWAELELGE